MDTTENKNSVRQTGNYHQPQTYGQDQTVLIDQSITAETDEQDLQSRIPPVDPEEDGQEDDDDFPAEEDLEEDYDLDQDTDEPGLDTDEDEFELKRSHFSTLLSAKQTSLCTFLTMFGIVFATFGATGIA